MKKENIIEELQKLDNILPLLLRETENIKESAEFAESYHPYTVENVIELIKKYEKKN